MWFRCTKAVSKTWWLPQVHRSRRDKIRLIHRFTENVTVIYDSDAAGIKASIRGIDLLWGRLKHQRCCCFPMATTPIPFACKTQCVGFYWVCRNQLSDFIRFKTNLLLKDGANDPIKRAVLCQRYCTKYYHYSQLMIISEYVRNAVRSLLWEAMLYHEINKIKIYRKGKN